MSSLSQFGASMYKTGQVRLLNPNEDTLGYVKGGTVISKTTFANLYAKLQSINPLLANDAPDISTLSPYNDQGFKNIVTPNIGALYGIQPIWTGTYYISVDSYTGIIYYSTTLAGTWNIIPNQLYPGTDVNGILHNIYNIDFDSTNNRLIVTRYKAITYIDLTGGITSTTKEIIVVIATTISQPVATWNQSLNKIVYYAGTGTSPVITAVSINGTGAVNFTGMPATQSLIAMRCIGGVTYAIFTAASGTQVYVAPSTSTTFASATSNSVVMASTSLNTTAGAFTECIQSNGGTNIVIAYQAATTNYLTYYSYNGSTWTSNTSTTALEAAGKLRTTYDGTRWYFSTFVVASTTLNMTAYITTFGGTISVLSSTYKVNASSNKIVVVGYVNSKLYWYYKNSTTETYRSLFSTQNQFSTNAQEGTVLPTVLPAGTNVGYSSFNSKYYVAIPDNAMYTTSNTRFLGMFVYSSTDGINYTQENLYDAINNTTGDRSSITSDCDIHQIRFYSGTVSWFSIRFGYTTVAAWQSFIFSTNDNFVTLRNSQTYSHTSSDITSWGACISTCDGTNIYHAYRYADFPAADTRTLVVIRKCLLSTGVDSTLVTPYNFSIITLTGEDNRPIIGTNNAIVALSWDTTNSKLHFIYVYQYSISSAAYYYKYGTYNSSGTIVNALVTGGSVNSNQSAYIDVNKPIYYNTDDATIRVPIATNTKVFYICFGINTGDQLRTISQTLGSSVLFQPNPDGTYYTHQNGNNTKKYINLDNLLKDVPSNILTHNAFYTSLPYGSSAIAGKYDVIDANSLVFYTISSTPTLVFTKVITNTSNFMLPDPQVSNAPITGAVSYFKT